ncbi:MoxR family ATPase [Streptomyces sp. FXJ1.4098]|nr:MoxR family ATPase [Streptomyces sp. FXJ1.4098]
MTGTADTWRLFRRPETHGPVTLPPGPPWRRFGTRRAPRPPYVMRDRDADIVNTALHLRRPLLVTGYPGAGKSSLAYALADDLGLGDVLHWPVNSRSALTDALYRYDAVGRLRDATAQSNTGEAPLPVQDYVTLGPLGTALAAPAGHPRVLLIDELDKGDIDLPNDLLTVFEDGAFEIPELSRLASASGEARAEVRLTRPAPHRSVGSPAHPGSVEETPPATAADSRRREPFSRVGCTARSSPSSSSPATASGSFLRPSCAAASDCSSRTPTRNTSRPSSTPSSGPNWARRTSRPPLMSKNSSATSAERRATDAWRPTSS